MVEPTAGAGHFPYGPMGGPDPGPAGAVERTSLAWQRTALATAGGAAVTARLTFIDIGAWAFAPLAPSLLLGLWLMLEGRGRYRHAIGQRLRRGPYGGLAPLLLSTALALMCVTSLITIVLG